MEYLRNFSLYKANENVEALKPQVTELESSVASLTEKIAMLSKKSGNNQELFEAIQQFQLQNPKLLEKKEELKTAEAELTKQILLDFNQHLASYVAQKPALDKRVLDLQTEIDVLEAANKLNQVRTQELMSIANPSYEILEEIKFKIEQAANEQQNIYAKQDELTAAANELAEHESIVLTATALQNNLQTLKAEVDNLQTALNTLPISSKESIENSNVVNYLAIGHDFGGLVSYNSYKNIHGNIPVTNDVSLSSTEKNSLTSLMTSQLKDSMRGELSSGETLDIEIREKRASYNLILNNDKAQQAKNRIHNEEVAAMIDKRNSDLHKASKDFYRSFISDFTNGIKVAVNGVIANPASPKASEEEKAKAFTNMGKLFDSPEIAGKVLAPFTKANMEEIGFTLGNEENNFIGKGLKDAIQNFYIDGNPILSAQKIHVNKVSDDEYSVKSYFSIQKDNGTYAHYMLACTVTDVNLQTPTYTVTDVDAICHRHE